ncbi:MAG TPA: hypothetical protein VNK46_12900 [Nitrospiraceae bacterium]|jgi:hypothetical protein|nr:hypothetical protein [Nitrospiraceae bacterium]
MARDRWHLTLVEEQDFLPVPWTPQQSEPRVAASLTDMGAAGLIAACTLLACRGPGPQAWTLGYRHDPVAFLLDTIEEAVCLWTTDGARLYRNRAAEVLNLDWRGCVRLEHLRHNDRDLERRCASFSFGNAAYVLEIVHEVRHAEKSVGARGENGIRDEAAWPKDDAIAGASKAMQGTP